MCVGPGPPRRRRRRRPGRGQEGGHRGGGRPGQAGEGAEEGRSRAASGPPALGALAAQIIRALEREAESGSGRRKSRRVIAFAPHLPGAPHPPSPTTGSRAAAAGAPEAASRAGAETTAPSLPRALPPLAPPPPPPPPRARPRAGALSTAPCCPSPTPPTAPPRPTPPRRLSPRYRCGAVEQLERPGCRWAGTAAPGGQRAGVRGEGGGGRGAGADDVTALPGMFRRSRLATPASDRGLREHRESRIGTGTGALIPRRWVGRSVRLLGAPGIEMPSKPGSLPTGTQTLPRGIPASRRGATICLQIHKPLPA